MARSFYQSMGLAVVCALALGGYSAAQQPHQHPPGGPQNAPKESAGTRTEVAPPGHSMGSMQDMMDDMQDMMEQMQGMMEHMQGMMQRGGTRGQARPMGSGAMMGRRGMGMMAQEQEDDDDDEDRSPRGMRGRGMMGHSMMGHGMMGHGMMRRGAMLMQHFEQLAQQLELTEAQRAQTRTILSAHAKDIIRLKAEIDTIVIDLRQVLETEPVDLPKGKQLIQAIAGKETDLRFAHLTTMQEISKLLTPEQQQKFRAIHVRMMGAGMKGHGGMMGHGMMGR